MFLHVYLKTCMIAHGHVDVKYAHYGLDFYPGDANHTIGSFARLRRDLERPPTSFSRALFVGCRITPLYEGVLEGKKVCLSLLQETPEQPVFAIPLPPTLHVVVERGFRFGKALGFWLQLDFIGPVESSGLLIFNFFNFF